MTNQEAIEHIKTIQIYSYQDGYTDKAREALDMAISALQAQDSPKPTAESVQNVQNEDLILRKAAIDAPFKKYDMSTGVTWIPLEYVEQLPSAQPERLTDDDFETIRIHLNAYKEKLCNQGRWKEAVKYQNIIDRFMAFASAQPERKWIPVSERLPEVGKDVMVCYDFKGHRSVLIGILYGDEKFHGYDDEYLTPEGRKYRKAVAWMPLPEPYRAERKTDEKKNI